MGCERWVTAISARLDGELGAAELAALDRHLAGCGACREVEAAFAEQHRRWRIRSAPDVPDLAAAVLAAPPKRHRRTGLVLGAVAASIAAVLGAVVVVQASEDDAPPPLLALASATVSPGDVGDATVLSLSLTNAGGPDRVVGVSSDLATRSEFHLVDDRNGLPVMRPVASVPVKAGDRARFSATSTHVMLVGLRERLVVGEQVSVWLEFARAGRVEVDAVVA